MKNIIIIFKELLKKNIIFYILIMTANYYALFPPIIKSKKRKIIFMIMEIFPYFTLALILILTFIYTRKIRYIKIKYLKYFIVLFIFMLGEVIELLF